jgi:hypothetical protein
MRTKGGGEEAPEAISVRDGLHFSGVRCAPHETFEGLQPPMHIKKSNEGEITMAGRNSFLHISMAAILAFALTGTVSANIWMDEKFEDGPFTQGNGDTVTPIASSELDTYSATVPITASVTGSPIAHTGALDTSKAFEGGACYKLTAGQELSCGPGYMNPTNGDIQVLQMALNVDPIPAAGTVGELRWNWDWDTGNPSPTGDHNWYVRLVSTGSVVNLVAGVEGQTTSSATVGTLTSNGKWAFVSLVGNKNSIGVTYTNTVFGPLGTIPSGISVFNSSYTPGFTQVMVLPAGPTTFNSLDWSLKATGGTIYVDNVYWEGGMDWPGGFSFPDQRPLSKAHPLNSNKIESNSAHDWQYLE